MTDIRRRALRAVAVVGAAGALYGCSSADSGGFTPSGSSSGMGNDNGSGDGSTRTGAGDDGATPNGGDAAGGSDAGPTMPDRDATALGRDGGGAADGGPSSSVDSGSKLDAGSGTTGGDASPDESAWLDPMNAARAAVGDPPLTWNPIAAQTALNYASLCNYQHNPNRSSDYQKLGGTGSLGENIAAGAPSLTIAGANMGWIQDEEPNYTYATNTCNTHGGTVECGHYTQIVWKTTTSVGCALVQCTTNTPFGPSAGNKWSYAVCDYAPPGNIVKNGVLEKPY